VIEWVELSSAEGVFGIAGSATELSRLDQTSWEKLLRSLGSAMTLVVRETPKRCSG